MTSRIDIVKEELRQRVKLNDLIFRLTNIEVKNGYMMCPFHNETVASMSVDNNKGLYYCFGCNAGGDIFSFVMQYQGLGFMDAIKYIDSLYCLNLCNQKITAHAMIASMQRDAEREKIANRHRALDELENKLCMDFRIANFAIHFLEPLTDLWGYFINQRVILEYQLDLIDQERRNGYG